MNEQQKLKKASYHLNTFLISKVFGSLGMNVYAFGMSMYILSMTGSALSFAANIICSILPRTIVSPIAGVLGDRLPRKWLVIGGQAGLVFTISCLLIYTLIFDLSVYAIYAATVMNSIFGTFSSIAFSSSIANLVDEPRLQKAMSYNQMSLSISGIGGPVFGGMLFGFVSMEIFLIIYIVSQVIALSLESTMNFNLYKKVVEASSEVKETMVESFKAGLSYVKQNRVLKAILITSLWLNFFFTALSVGGDFTFLTILQMEPTLIGFINAAIAVGMLVTSIYFASRSNVKYPLLFSKRSALILSSLVIFAGLPLLLSMPSTGNFIYYLVLMYLFGTSSILINTPIGVMLQTTIAEEYRSRVFSIVEMMAMCMMPLGMLIYGVLFDFVPAEIIFLISGAGLIIVTLVFLPRSIVEMAHPELKKENEQLKEEKLSTVIE